MKIKMNFLRSLIIAFVFISPPLHAVGEPLIVGIESFTPPFTIQVANQEIYGFNIDMMNELCKTIQRTCEFKIMEFDDLLPALVDKQIDVAVSSITITAERSKIVDFTIPYLLSYSRFLTRHSTESHQPFSLELLTDKRIGIEEGSIFGEQLSEMGVKNPIIIKYPTEGDMVEALRDDEIDFILLDNPDALYWEANSSGAFTVIGKPFMYGYGFGIAVNPDNKALLQSLNQAIIQYQGSKEYKAHYDRYLYQF